MLQILMSKDADSFLAPLEAKRYKQVASKVFALAKDPQPPDSAKLQGYNDLYRATVGEYRIVYRFDERTIL